MDITVKDLIRDLQLCDPETPVYFGGLDFYRVKDRGGVIQIEFSQSVYPDEYGLVWVENHDIKSLTAVDRNGSKEKFLIRYQDRELTDDCPFEGTLYTVYKKDRPALGFDFELITVDGSHYVKYVCNNDLPEVSGKGIIKAMLAGLSLFYKQDIYSSTNKDSCKLYPSEGLVPAMELAWGKFLNELDDVAYLPETGRYVFRYRY